VKLRATTLWWALGVMTALVGCRNVDLPDATALDHSSSPFVSLDFQDGTAVALSAPVSFTANSLIGVSKVSVYCGGGLALASWPSPPYQAQLDLSPCVPFGHPTDAGEGLLDLTLTASAVDTKGGRTDLPFTLRVDVSVPVLTTDLSERIRPGRPLAFTLTSSIPLGALPQLTLDDAPLTVTQDPQDARIFHVALARTPDLGIDALDGGAVTLDALQEVERTLTLKAEAVAPNGNHGKLTQTVLLSRVLWDKPLPAPLAAELVPFQPESLQAPTPIPSGLVVPLSNTVSASPGFTPGYFAADSGAVTVDQPLLDGGWTGFEIDAEGWVTVLGPLPPIGTFVPPNPTLYLDAVSPEKFVPTASTPAARPNRVRGEGQLCELVGAATDATSCAGSAPQLACIGHTGMPTGVPTASLQNGTDPTGGAFAQVVLARSGPQVFVGGYSRCDGSAFPPPSVGVGSRDGGLTFRSNQLPVEDGGIYQDCAFAQTYPVLPTGDGAFVLMPKVYCHFPSGGGELPYDQPVLLIGPDAGTLGSYAALSPWTPGTVGSAGVLGTFGPGHDLMVMKPSISGTALALFPPDAGQPSIAAVIPGVYEYPPDQATSVTATPSLSMPRDVVRGTTGVAVLTETSEYSRALMALGPDLQPRWIYRYPRLVFADAVHLYALDDTGPLYLVDSMNLRVLAIER